MLDGASSVPDRLERLSSEVLSEASDAWILAYEAYFRGWADPGSIQSSPFFQRMRDLGVTFVNDELGPLELSDDEDSFDPADFDLLDFGGIPTLYQ